jgi:hypothetical protein
VHIASGWSCKSGLMGVKNDQFAHFARKMHGPIAPLPKLGVILQ